MNGISSRLSIRYLGIQPYQTVWEAMKSFTRMRGATTVDEFWALQHPPVFTLGQAGKTEHLLDPGEIPVIKADRGGQVTYHGPGQLVLYLLVDIRRRKLAIRSLVTAMEEAIILTLGAQGLSGQARSDAPGVYVENAKIASLGLRVRNGCTFHGLSLNLNMDLEPFNRINVCGHKGLAVTQLADLVSVNDFNQVTESLVQALMLKLGYQTRSNISGMYDD